MKAANLFYSVLAVLVLCSSAIAQELASGEGMLDVSLFWKKSGEYVNRVESVDGDLYKTLGHHGPAIENAWAAYRIYFNDMGSIDILSKFQPRLELRTTKWYTGKSQKAQGYGMDNFLVKETVGLGGIRIWDGKAIQEPGPVTKRTAEVRLTDSTAHVRMTSFGIPYGEGSIDLEMTMTTFKGGRHALVEARILNGVQVQIVTGITVHDQLEVSASDDYILTWGDYDSPTAATAFDVGAALMINPDDFEQRQATEQEHLFISRPTTYLKFLISTANEKENSDLNNYPAFVAYIQQLAATLR